MDKTLAAFTPEDGYHYYPPLINISFEHDYSLGVEAMHINIQMRGREKYQGIGPGEWVNLYMTVPQFKKLTEEALAALKDTPNG